MNITIQKLKSKIRSGESVSREEAQKLLNELEAVSSEKKLVESQHKRFKEYFENSDVEYVGMIRLLGDVANLMKKRKWFRGP